MNHYTIPRFFFDVMTGSRTSRITLAVITGMSVTVGSYDDPLKRDDPSVVSPDGFR